VEIGAETTEPEIVTDTAALALALSSVEFEDEDEGEADADADARGVAEEVSSWVDEVGVGGV
jgi:hypothetical protein